jgi:hypothetical protein
MNAPDTRDTLVMTLPRDAHWGGEWIVRGRGIYYVNQHAKAGAAIELMPFTSTSTSPSSTSPGAVVRARPIRILSLTALLSGGAPFTIAQDESWLAWSQEDHRAGDIMMIEGVP